MDTEAAFQAALDADPSNAGLRMIFADWLDEQGDPRGPGYRALGRLGLAPHFYQDAGESPRGRWGWWPLSEAVREEKEYRASYPRGGGDGYRWAIAAGLPDEWFNLVYPNRRQLPPLIHKRRTAENRAALAWSRLSPAEQDRILSQVEVPA